MKVKITGSELENYWYSKLIGDVFEVKPFGKNHFTVEQTSPRVLLINGNDCEVIPEVQEVKKSIAIIVEDCKLCPYARQSIFNFDGDCCSMEHGVEYVKGSVSTKCKFPSVDKLKSKGRK